MLSEEASEKPVRHVLMLQLFALPSPHRRTCRFRRERDTLNDITAVRLFRCLHFFSVSSLLLLSYSMLPLSHSAPF
jgi:hypothetical protein